MSKFGWSYPPGCSGTPFDEDHPCECCGLFPDDCICPECPECGEHGNPKCYEGHGLTRTAEQIENLAREQEKWRKAAQNEAEYFKNLGDQEAT